jgi:hypothetical protein
MQAAGKLVDQTPENHHGANFVEITVVGTNGSFIR